MVKYGFLVNLPQNYECMKQFSIVLNLLLLAAVGVLYYLHFSASRKDKAATWGVKPVTNSNAGASTPSIAYIEQDSLNYNVLFIKEKRKEIELEQKAIADEYEKSYHNLEAKKNNFIQQQSGKSPKQEEIDAFQQQLVNMQQEIENTRQVKGQKLAEKSAKAIEELQNKVKAFLDEYNKDKRYTYILATGTGMDYLFYKDSALNITQEIIEGLNNKMKDSLK